jgi:hypothetical protein
MNDLLQMYFEIHSSMSMYVSVCNLTNKTEIRNSKDSVLCAFKEPLTLEHFTSQRVSDCIKNIYTLKDRYGHEIVVSYLMPSLSQKSQRHIKKLINTPLHEQTKKVKEANLQRTKNKTKKKKRKKGKKKGKQVRSIWTMSGGLPS